VSRGQRGESPTVVNPSFLDLSRPLRLEVFIRTHEVTRKLSLYLIKHLIIVIIIIIIIIIIIDHLCGVVVGVPGCRE
jgi:hypothetical protein